MRGLDSEMKNSDDHRRTDGTTPARVDCFHFMPRTPINTDVSQKSVSNVAGRAG